MKVFVFLVALVIFLASFVLFGYAFAVEGLWQSILFLGGIIAVSVSLAIPFHLLPAADQR
jgi:hypothetical protein